MGNGFTSYHLGRLEKNRATYTDSESWTGARLPLGCILLSGCTSASDIISNSGVVRHQQLQHALNIVGLVGVARHREAGTHHMGRQCIVHGAHQLVRRFGCSTL